MQQTKTISVNTGTDVTSGVITEATVVDLTFSQDVFPSLHELTLSLTV